MSCTTCKKTRADIEHDVINKTKTRNVKDYFLKSLLFLFLAIIITPFIIPIFIVVLFRMVILSKELNLLPVVLYLGRKIFKEEEDDDEEDDDEVYDNLSEEEYELLDKNEIIEFN